MLKLINLMMITYENYVGNGDFGVNPDVNVKFGELKFDTSPEEQGNIDLIQLQTGEITKADIIIRANPDVNTPDKLREFLQRRAEFDAVMDEFTTPIGTDLEVFNDTEE